MHKQLLTLWLLVTLCVTVGLAQSPTVTITGAVVDNNGTPYYTGKVQLISGNGSGPQAWTYGGKNPINPTVPIAGLDGFGNFIVSVMNTSLIDQQSAVPQWQFSFCSAGSPPPIVCFTVPGLALTSSQSITGQINAAGIPIIPGHSSNISNPLILDAGLSGDTNYRKFELHMMTNGQFITNFLNSSGANPDIFNAQVFSPFFKVAPEGVGGLGAGLWVQSIPLFEFAYTGGGAFQGTLATYAMPDPTTGACVVSHIGAGGAGAPAYYGRWLDAESGYSNHITCTPDPTGYPTPDPSHENVISYFQDQGGAGHYGGSYSNFMIARGDPLTGVLNLSGLGVLSTLPACSNVSSNPCTYTDDGSASTTTLSALAGAFYQGDSNSTNKALIQGQLYTLGENGGNSLTGGTNHVGRFTTQMIATPSAPTVVPNTTGATSYSYAVVVNDEGLGQTVPSSDTTITNGNASPNNTISWNISFSCKSVSVYLHSSGTYYSMPGSTNLPCFGTNTVGGFGPLNPMSYNDTGGTRTPASLPGRNTASDIFLDSSGSTGLGGSLFALNGVVSSYFVVGAGNVSGSLVFGCVITNQACDNTKGYILLDPGDSTHDGSLQWYDHTGTLKWSMGGGTGADLPLNNNAGGGKFRVNAAIDVNGVDVISSGANVDAGRLAATSAVAPFAALGTGGTGSGHCLSDAGTWINCAVSGSLVTTAAVSDAATVTGATSSSHCTFSPTNALAATNISTAYISAKGTNSVTITHSVNANMNFDIVCTTN